MKQRATPGDFLQSRASGWSRACSLRADLRCRGWTGHQDHRPAACPQPSAGSSSSRPGLSPACHRPRSGRPTEAAQPRGHDPARHLRRQQPVGALREDRRDPDRIVDPEAYEPAEQEVVFHLLHQLPRRAERTPLAGRGPGTGCGSGSSGSAAQAGSRAAQSRCKAPRIRHSGWPAHHSRPAGSCAGDAAPGSAPQGPHS